MTPFVDDPDFTLYVGDAIDVLREMPAESVHCCVTSPPYWGLRDYGTGSWDGGDADCDHQRPKQKDRTFYSGSGADGKNCLSWTERDGSTYLDACGKCGARRVDQQLGLEATPDEYVANMVAVFREVRRVLRSDGTLWLNIGDSYVAGQGGRQSSVGEMPAAPLQRMNEPRYRDDVDTGSWASRDVTAKMTPARGTTFLKPKDLVGIPWRLAFALQADGWYLRSDIIWSKPNPMPESVTDRPTKAHEYLFLLTKSPRYFYDADAIREPFSGGTHSRGSMVPREMPKSSEPGSGIKNNSSMSSAIWAQAAKPPPQVETLDGSEGETPRGPDGRRKTHVEGGDGSLQHRDGERWTGTNRNKRSVWEIATEAYPDAHFATFPQALVEPCVKAGCPFDGVVLDPFLGSGTTALVARRLGRKCIGIELNPDYAQLCAKRLQQLSLFASEHAEA